MRVEYLSQYNLFSFFTFSGTRTDELSLAEQGAAGSRSDSIVSSEHGGYDNEDTQNVVGEPADEGLIAGVGDDILYPEVSK